MASDLVNLLSEINARADKNTKIFHSSLDFYAQESYETPLRYGAYIFFNEEVQAVMYSLLDLKLKPTSEQLRGKNPLHNYVVIKIVPGIVHAGDSSELLVNQQLASVLSQLDEREKNDENRRREHLKFLQDTIESANNMQELDYFHRLRIKKKLGDRLTDSQLKRYLEIAEKLHKYTSELSD